MIVPIVMIMMAVAFVWSSLSSVVQGGYSRYDENTFQDYADAQYQAEFGTSSAYEDNILLVFLTEDDEYYDYCYIAWVGDHVVTDISYMFGDERTALGSAISNAVNESSYKYSLDSDLAGVIESLKLQITLKGLETSFTCGEDHAQVQSHLTNKTSLNLTEQTVNAALQSFTDTTGIPIVLVVDDIEDVFPKQVPVVDIAIAVLLIAAAVFLIVRGLRSKKKDDDSEDRYYNSDNRY